MKTLVVTHLCVCVCVLGGTMVHWRAQKPNLCSRSVRSAVIWWGKARPSETTIPSLSGKLTVRTQYTDSVTSFQFKFSHSAVPLIFISFSAANHFWGENDCRFSLLVWYNRPLKCPLFCTVCYDCFQRYNNWCPIFAFVSWIGSHLSL